MSYEQLKVENLARCNCVVFLLGAGASKDYGFPLWNDLRIFFEENLEKIIKKQSDIFPEITLTDEELENLSKWIGLIHNTDWAISTIDNIIYRNGAIKDPILKLLSYKISLCEREDVQSGNDDKWISILAEKIADYLISRRLGNKTDDANIAADFFSKIKIITLNYDRCFEYHFSLSLRHYLERGLDLNNSDWAKYYRNICWDVIHPHGAIANHVEPDKNCFQMKSNYGTYKNPNSNMFRSYGQINEVSIEIAEVDDLKDGHDKNAYRLTNSYISGADMIISLGVSPAGVNNSHISFPDGANYYFSNHEKDRDKIEERIKSKDQTYLNKRCGDFIQLL